MNTKEKILELSQRIEKRRDYITQQEKLLESELKELKSLRLKYDQEKLSDMAKNGINNKETRQWWLNRY